MAQVSAFFLIPLIIDEICDHMRDRGNLSLKLRFNRENHDKKCTDLTNSRQKKFVEPFLHPGLHRRRQCA